MIQYKDNCQHYPKGGREMYEHLKMREILCKLDEETVETLRQKWPEINYPNCNARDVFRRMVVKTLSDLYDTGLKINCSCLTVLAAEALIAYDSDYRRRNYATEEDSITRNIIVKKLQHAFDRHQMVMGGNLASVLGFTFLDKCYEYDYLLAKYGYELSRNLIFMGPEDWLKETVKHSKRAPLIALKTPWAKALLEA